MSLLKWALIFMVVAAIAGLLGFTDLAGAAAGAARFLFVVFLVICGVLVLLGVTIYRAVT